MDLVALVTGDGSLLIYRTISWERILHRNVSESGNDSAPCVVCFAPEGNLVSIGHTNGLISVLNIETLKVDEAYTLKTPAAEISMGSSVINLVWVKDINEIDTGKDTSGIDKDDLAKVTHANNMHVFRNLDAATNIISEEMEEARGLCVENTLKDSLLFAFLENGYLHIYLSGIYPIYQIMNQEVLDRPLYFYRECDKSACNTFYEIWSQQQQSESASTLSSSERCKLLLDTHRSIHFNDSPTPCDISRSLTQYHNNAIVDALINLKSDIIVLQNLISSCLKKWKDALRPIGGKTTLLQGLLSGYQIAMSPLQFYYTVSMCGLWHPAAVMCFSQHWNEQGLSRLKNSFDSVSKMTIKILQFGLNTKATQMAISCLEVYKLLERQISSTNDGKYVFELQNIANLKNMAEVLLYKVDDALTECRKARDNIMLFIHFIREYHIKALNLEANEEGKRKVPQISAKKYLDLFDLRKPRITTNDMTLQGESLVGTHQYAYFQDADLPPNRKTAFVQKDGGEKDQQKEAKESEIETKEGLIEKVLHGCVSDISNERRSFLDTFENKSLVQVLKEFGKCIDECMKVASERGTKILRDEANFYSREIKSSGHTKGKLSLLIQQLHLQEIKYADIIFLNEWTASCVDLADIDSLNDDEGESVTKTNETCAIYVKEDIEAVSGFSFILVCVASTTADDQDKSAMNTEESKEDEFLVAELEPEIDSSNGILESLRPLYAKFLAVGSGSDTSLSLLVIAVTQAEEQVVFKLDIQDIMYTRINAGDVPLNNASTSIPLQSQNEKVEAMAKTIGTRPIIQLEVSQKRGIAAAIDDTGKISVIDLDL